MATYRKRSGGWRAEIFKKGVRESQTFPTKMLARAWATQREAEIHAGINQPKNVDFTFKQALEKYALEVSPRKAGMRWEALRIRRFITEMPFVNQSIIEIKANLIAVWRDNRLTQVASSTVRREMNLLSNLFEIARTEWQWCKHNPVREIKRPANHRPRDRRIDNEEEQALLNALGYVEGKAPYTSMQEMAYILLIALETAMRQGEILKLTLDNINLPQRYIQLLKTKNGDARKIPLSQRAIQLLDLLEKNARQQNRIALFNINSAYADVLFRRVRDKLKIENLHFHDTRHEAITRLAQKLEVLDLARMTGHRDLRSLMVYYNATAGEVASRLDK